MSKLKSIIKYLLAIVIIVVIVVGVVEIFDSKKYIDNIRESGIKGTATVDSIWRQRCGSGYSNSAILRLSLSDTTYRLNSDCNLSRETKKGDVIEIIYMKEDPTTFALK